MNKHKIFIFVVFSLLILIIVLLLINFIYINNQQPSPPYVMISDHTISVQIADNQEEQIQGLSDRSEICAECGMLFVFKNSQERGFWMKNMNFPLDIIWINDNSIIKIDKRLQPEGDTPQHTYNSQAPVNYVLEVNGGYSDAFNINVGDTVDIEI